MAAKGKMDIQVEITDVRMIQRPGMPAQMVYTAKIGVVEKQIAIPFNLTAAVLDHIINGFGIRRKRPHERH